MSDPQRECWYKAGIQIAGTDSSDPSFVLNDNWKWYLFSRWERSPCFRSGLLKVEPEMENLH